MQAKLAAVTVAFFLVPALAQADSRSRPEVKVEDKKDEYKYEYKDGLCEYKFERKHDTSEAKVETKGDCRGVGPERRRGDRYRSERY